MRMKEIAVDELQKEEKEQYMKNDYKFGNAVQGISS